MLLSKLVVEHQMRDEDDSDIPNTFALCQDASSWCHWKIWASKNIKSPYPRWPFWSNVLPPSFLAFEINLWILGWAIYWFDPYWFSVNENLFQFLRVSNYLFNIIDFPCHFFYENIIQSCYIFGFLLFQYSIFSLTK